MARNNKNAPAESAAAEIEVVEKGGLGIDEGIVLATFFLLVGAVVTVYFATQAYATTTV